MAALIAGCTEYRVGLPNGWTLALYSGGEYLLFRRAENSLRIEQAIGPVVERYRVIDHWVVGYVAPWYAREAGGGTPGYFILDTATGHAWEGLDEAAWRRTLNEQGLPDSPELKRPGAWDADRPWQELASRWRAEWFGVTALRRFASTDDSRK